MEGFRLNSDRSETLNKTIRFPLELTKEIENAIEGKDVTFSGFVIQACKYALKNMEVKDSKKKKIIKFKLLFKKFEFYY